MSGQGARSESHANTIAQLARATEASLPLIVLGLLARIVLPFVAGIFDQLAREPLLVGVTVTAYLLSMRFSSTRVPPALTAVFAGVLVAAATGRIEGSPASTS